MSIEERRDRVRLSLLRQLYSDRIPLDMLLFRYGFLLGLATLVLGYGLTLAGFHLVGVALSPLDVLAIYVITQVPVYCYLHTQLLLVPLFTAFRKIVDPAWAILLLGLVSIFLIVLMTPLAQYHEVWSPYLPLVLVVLGLPTGLVILFLALIRTEAPADRRHGERREP